MSTREGLKLKWLALRDLSPIVVRARKREQEQLVQVFELGFEAGWRRTVPPRLQRKYPTKPATRQGRHLHLV